MVNFLERMKPQLPTILITILTLRAVVFGAGFGDALCVIALAGLFGYKSYLDTKKVADPTAELAEEVNKIKGELSNIAVAGSQRKTAEPLKYRF